MRVSAVLSFRVTLAGMDCPAHAGLTRAAPKIQRALVQGSVVVVLEVVVVEVAVVVEVPTAKLIAHTPRPCVAAPMMLEFICKS